MYCLIHYNNLERLEEYNNLKYQKEALLSMREELASELELMNAAGFQECSRRKFLFFPWFACRPLKPSPPP